MKIILVLEGKKFNSVNQVKLGSFESNIQVVEIMGQYSGTYLCQYQYNKVYCYKIFKSLFAKKSGD